ncbi:MAG TPA: DUF1028 domain-containing protein [Blastocatellia bacterium]|nr:DUF1028 domain-containing protein [Blastocatellia bacterium]
MNTFVLRTLVFRLLVAASVATGLFISSAHATYSIVACDHKTVDCGVAVQTNNLAVGASVPYARAGVGAVASQFETNPNYGPKGLALLEQGRSPSDVLKQLLDEDGQFEGQGPEARQVAIVNLDGKTAVHTGTEAQDAAWAGSRTGPGYSIQGNGLAGPQVIESMERAFVQTQGTLAERLLAALSAGDRAGGQTTGRESAALLVKTRAGYPVDTDLRVDHSTDPVGDLRNLFDMRSARQQVAQARRVAANGRLEQARGLLIAAVARGWNWSRIWIQAARVAADIEEPDLALQYLSVAFSENPAWIENEIGNGFYPGLGSSPIFHRWVSAVCDQQVLAAYKDVQLAKEANVQTRIQVAKRLLEAGHSEEALTILNGIQRKGGAASGTGGIVSGLVVDAYAAQRKYRDALEQCTSALTANPSDQRIRTKAIWLEGKLRN